MIFAIFSNQCQNVFALYENDLSNEAFLKHNRCIGAQRILQQRDTVLLADHRPAAGLRLAASAAVLEGGVDAGNGLQQQRGIGESDNAAQRERSSASGRVLTWPARAAEPRTMATL